MKKFLRSILCFCVAVTLLVESNGGAFSAHAMEEMEQDVTSGADSYLYPFENAVTALEELAETKEIPAVVYLADSIGMRELPEETSESVKELVSGDEVSIIGVEQDAEGNIWYQVSYTNEWEVVNGYLPKTNVACVDQDFRLSYCN